MLVVVSVAPVEQRLHSLRLAAVDEAGNVGNDVVVQWRLDTVPPLVTLSTATLVDRGIGRTSIASGTFEFSSSEPNAAIECRISYNQNENDFEPCTSPRGFSLDDKLLVLDQQHNVTFQVRARDEAGNVGDCASAASSSTQGSHACVQHQWTLDVRPPSFLMQSLLPPPALNTNQSCMFHASVDSTISALQDDVCVVPSRTMTFRFVDTERVDKFFCRLDSSPWYVCGTAGSEDTVPAVVRVARGDAYSFQADQESFLSMSDGLHQFEVYAMSDHFVSSPSQTYIWVVDATPPTARVVAKPAAWSRRLTSTVAFSVDEASTTLECRVDTSVYLDCTNGLALMIGNESSSASSVGAGSVWTPWQSNHLLQTDAMGGGDVESLSCAGYAESATPLAVQCRIACDANDDACSSLDFAVATAGLVLATPCVIDGGRALIECRNRDQASGRSCPDFALRVLCGTPDNYTGVQLGALGNSSVWADGVPILQHGDAFQAHTLQIPADTSQLAVRVVSAHVASLIATLPHLSLVSDEGWACTWEDQTDDESWLFSNFTARWPSAVPVSSPNNVALSSILTQSQAIDAKWISGPTSSTQRQSLFCRRALSEQVGEMSVLPLLSLPLSRVAYSLDVRATDRYGNSQETPGIVEWGIDLKAPSFTMRLPTRVNSETVSTALVTLELVDEAPKYIQGVFTLPSFELFVNGQPLAGMFCSPGAFYCGDECVADAACDTNVTDSVPYDPLPACGIDLQVCDVTRTMPLPIGRSLKHGINTVAVVSSDLAGNRSPLQQQHILADLQAERVVLPAAAYVGRAGTSIAVQTDTLHMLPDECAESYTCSVFSSRGDLVSPCQPVLAAPGSSACSHVLQFRTCWFESLDTDVDISLYSSSPLSWTISSQHTSLLAPVWIPLSDTSLAFSSGSLLLDESVTDVLTCLQHCFILGCRAVSIEISQQPYQCRGYTHAHTRGPPAQEQILFFELQGTYLVSAERPHALCF